MAKIYEKSTYVQITTLIGELKKEGRECIYDLSCHDYKNTYLKHKVWTEVAEVLAIHRNACQALWRNLRTKYKLVLAKERENPGCSKFKPMAKFLLREMDFFRKYVEDEDNDFPPEKRLCQRKSNLPSPAHSSNDNSNLFNWVETTMNDVKEEPNDDTIEIYEFGEDHPHSLDAYEEKHGPAADAEDLEQQEQLSNRPFKLTPFKSCDCPLSSSMQQHQPDNVNEMLDMCEKHCSSEKNCSRKSEDTDSSDSLFGKLVTAMLKEIAMDDSKDDVKLQIMQLLINAKRSQGADKKS